MPEVSLRTSLQLLVLVLVIPLQYWLSRETNEGERQAELKGLVAKVGRLGQDCWELVIRCGRQLRQLLLHRAAAAQTEAETIPSSVSSDGSETSKVQETGHFASSTEPRTERPRNLKYRVGQVLRHTKWNYRGVIIGWDDVTKAPEEWIKQMHPNDKPEWRSQPNYAVLVDTRDRLTPQMTYVVQDNIQIVEGMHIYNPLVDHYFETFDGKRYISRPWHRKIYPQD